MMTAHFAIKKSASLYFLKFYILAVACLIQAQDDGLIKSLNECERTCVSGELPRTCYYSFHVEFYTTMGPACDDPQQAQCIMADGVERTVTSINRQIPGPTIEVCVGDLIVVDVENSAPGTEVTIHWHGIFQRNGYQYYDGVPYVTQCPIHSGTTFRYQFVADNPGTNFYHSHISTQMVDGQYGALIVNTPPSEDPYSSLFDEDTHIMLISDWLHEISYQKFPGRYAKNIGQAAENILINGRGNWTDPDTKESTNAPLAEFTVSRGVRYRFRIINSCSLVCPIELSFGNHRCTLISQDSADVRPKVVDLLIMTSGERADCIINTNQSVDSYWIRVRALGECAEKSVQQFAVLRYDGAPPFPSTPAPEYNDVTPGVIYNPLNGTNCGTQNTDESVCVNQLESLDDDIVDTVADEEHVVSFQFFNYTAFNKSMLFQPNTFQEFFIAADRSQLLSMMNNISYQSPPSPLISEGYVNECTPNQVSTCTEPCRCTQIINVPRDSVVDVCLVDEVPLDDLHHPIHLHGQEFQVLHIGQFPPNTTAVSKEDVDQVLMEHRERIERGEYKNRPRKDTVKIPQGGYSIIRFVANNPGWWIFHCHFTWHHVTGMELVFHVGEAYDLPPPPPGFPMCYNWVPPIQPPVQPLIQSSTQRSSYWGLPLF